MKDFEPRTVPCEASRSLGPGPILVLAAQPGDEALGCGGAIVRHVAVGDPGQVIIVTDGTSGADEGGECERITLQGEAHCASAVLGYGRGTFWAFPQGGLEYGELLIERILETIESSHARLVYSPSWSEINPDHRALAMAAAEAVRRSGLEASLVMYELSSPLHPNRLLDISDIHDRKQAAVHCFESRIARQPCDQQIAALNRFRTYTLPRSVLAAEAYRVIAQEDLRADPIQIPPPQDEARRSALQVRRSEPLVSVLVRSMNRDVLTEALDSIALQTYPHIEILVIDATGGRHRTLPLWWGRFPLRFIASDGPLRRSAAANRGMSEARGEFLMFLDDDDLLEPDHLSTLVTRLSASTDKRCAYSGVRVDYLHNSELVRSETLSHPFNRHQLRGRNYIPIHAVLFHRSLYDQGCRFDETLDTLEDWDFWLQLSALTDFAYIDKVTARYRNSGSSGYGARIEAAQLLNSTAAVFEKWRTRWSGIEWAEILLERDRMRDEVAAQTKALHNELESNHAQLQESQRRAEALSQRIREYQAALAQRSAHRLPGPPPPELDIRGQTRLLETQDSADDGRMSRPAPTPTPIQKLSQLLFRRSDDPQKRTAILEEMAVPGIIPADMHRPTPMLTPRHLMNARFLEHRGRILELVPDGSICCEVGIGGAVFSRQILNDAKPGRLHLIEIEPQIVERTRAIFASEVAAGQVQTHLGDSAEVLLQFPSNYFDWVYLDASPNYELVKGELEACRTRVKGNGWIIVHNYIYWDHVIGCKYGVMEATNEFCLAHDYELLYLALHSESFNDAVIRRIPH